VAGNRFKRLHTIPESGVLKAARWELVVDVLTPSYRSYLVPSQPHGTLFLDELPGLGTALEQPGTVVDLRVRLTTGHQVVADLVLPDVISAICLKAYAYQGRLTDRDAVDLWRLLEAANAAGVTSATWPTGITGQDAAAVLHQHFGRPSSAGPAQASNSPADRARMRALVLRVVGAAPTHERD
jgi:hypothetical protein